MARRLKQQSLGCPNRGRFATCMQNRARSCVLYDNPYMAPGPCSRMGGELDAPKRKKKTKGLLALLRRDRLRLIEALCTRGPFEHRIYRYLRWKRNTPEEQARLDRGLLESASRGDLFGIKTDLMWGANPEAREEGGEKRTVLMLIADAPLTRLDQAGREVDNKGRLLAAADMLLDYKPDLGATDKEGRTAFDIAKASGFGALAVKIGIRETLQRVLKKIVK